MKMRCIDIDKNDKDCQVCLHYDIHEHDRTCDLGGTISRPLRGHCLNCVPEFIEEEEFQT
jgi:hypothetical protein